MTLPKLHVRDLFWLVLVVGISLNYWLDHTGLRVLVQELRVQLNSAEIQRAETNINVRRQLGPLGYKFQETESGQLIIIPPVPAD